MPYTVDMASFLERRVELLLADVRAPHRSRRAAAHSEVAALLDELVGSSPAGAPSPHAPESDFAEALARDLASFEAGQRAQGVVARLQLEALARMLATTEAELAARHSQSWVDLTPLGAREAVVMEVATVTGLGHAEVGTRLELAVAPEARFGFVRSLVGEGAVTLQRACRLVDAVRPLDDDLADSVARAVLAPTRDGAGLSPRLFSQRLTRAMVAADADHAARRRAARQRIGVHSRLFDDGTGTLTVTHDAERIAAVVDRADAAARAARAAGDPRSLDELRADFLADAVTHGWPVADETFGAMAPLPSGRVWLVVPVTTALGLDDAPCELPGHGWVSAQHARQIMTADGSVWHTLLADVDTGRALDLQRAGYRPSRAMVEHVRAVDGVCRAPGCTVPARQCDLDHDAPWPHGPTDVANLTAKHRAHHRVRTAGWWTATRDGDDVRWRTASARELTTRPYDWLDGVRPPVAAGTPPPSHPPEPPPF